VRILRNEEYLGVRRRKPAPYLIRGRMKRFRRIWAFYEVVNFCIGKPGKLTDVTAVFGTASSFT